MPLWNACVKTTELDPNPNNHNTEIIQKIFYG